MRRYTETIELGAMARREHQCVATRVEPLPHLACEVVPISGVDFIGGGGQCPERSHASSSICGPASARSAEGRAPLPHQPVARSLVSYRDGGGGQAAPARQRRGY